MRKLRRPAVALALWIGLAVLGNSAAYAQVIRCVDGAGNVSYTDQRCPANTRSAEQVMGPEATDPRLAPPEPRPSSRFAPAAPSSSVPPLPASAARSPSVADRSAEERADDSTGYPYPYPYPYPYRYPDSGYRQPGPPQDMRPQLRSCDAGGCNDTLGNRYNPTGKLQSYQGLNGQRCQPVGTTVVCR